METNDIREHLKMYNSSGYRQTILRSIISGLRDELSTHEEKRKFFYKGMDAYYSVDHACVNYGDELEERELVKVVEAIFFEEMGKRELSEPEKAQIRIDRFMKQTKYEQMVGDSQGDNWINLFI